MNKSVLRTAAARVVLLAVMLAAGAGLAALPATPSVQAQATTGVLAPNGQRGVAFVHTTSAPFGSPASYESLKRLHDTGANWVSIITPFRQHDARAVEFYRSPNDPSDSGISQMIIYAHSLGMRVMVQPIVLADDGVWNGFFEPEDPGRWFANYSDQVAAYAALAQSVQADEFCVGTEFFTLTTPQYSQQWRQVVSAVRLKYFGPLTYSANWGDKKTPEYATIDWWDTLDFIGISAYFPLSWNNFLTQPLSEGWRHYRDPFGSNAVGQEFHWFDSVAAVQSRWNKPVQFTKIGFGSYANSPGRWDLQPDPYLELTVQANAYDATMQVWGNVNWMTGIFWTPWYSDPNAGGPLDNGESPQNKPAEQVLRQWYTR